MGRVLLITWGCIAGEKHIDLKKKKKRKLKIKLRMKTVIPDQTETGMNNLNGRMICGIEINNLSTLSKAFVVSLWCTIVVFRAMQRGAQNKQSDYLEKWQIIHKIRYRIYKRPYFSGEFDAIQEHSKRILEEKALSH